MNSKFKQLRHNAHISFDRFMAYFFSSQKTLEKISASPHKPLNFYDFQDIRYSKKEHFRLFRILPIHKKLSPSVCDLKVYQDSLVYTFITDNLPTGSRLLEIGGGESRIISQLKERYVIWNLDKLQGSGFGPKNLINTEGFFMVQDYIGNFSETLPDSYFDLVFSISTIEHLPTDNEIICSVINDINRLIKPGGFSLHCIDALLYDEHYFVHPFVSKVFEKGIVDYEEVLFKELKDNNEVWMLPSYAFYTRWYHLVKKPLRTFGHPFSINLLWQKQDSA